MGRSKPPGRSCRPACPFQRLEDLAARVPARSVLAHRPRLLARFGGCSLRCSTQRPRGPVCWPGSLLLPAEGLPAADAHRQHPPRPPPLPAAALLQGCAQRHCALRDDGGGGCQAGRARLASPGLPSSVLSILVNTQATRVPRGRGSPSAGSGRRGLRCGSNPVPLLQRSLSSPPGHGSQAGCGPTHGPGGDRCDCQGFWYSCAGLLRFCWREWGGDTRGWGGWGHSSSHGGSGGGGGGRRVTALGMAKVWAGAERCPRAAAAPWGAGTGPHVCPRCCPRIVRVAG